LVSDPGWVEADPENDRSSATLAIEDLRFTPRLLTKPAPRDLTVETTLQHFAIVTYWVDPVSLRKHLHHGLSPSAFPLPWLTEHWFQW
jgi:hypothetical protein